MGGKAILDHLIGDIEGSGLVDGYVVVSNHKFASIFGEWIAAHPLRDKIALVDDGSETNESRLGAVMDISLGIKSRGIDDELFVMAGDNLLSFSLKDFLRYGQEKGTACIMRYSEPDPARLRKCGVAEVDESDRVLSLVEKPSEPKSHWCCPPFYYFTRSGLALIDKAIEEGCGIDAPGSLIAWLCTHAPVHAWEMPGPRYDIGNLESYHQVKQIFEGR